MAKFITTTEISYSIEQSLKNANEFIIWVTPYVQIHSRLQTLVEKKMRESTISMAVICREKELSIIAKNWFLDNGIKLYFNDSLHAKCYLNENTVILTSMNLYHYSMVNNIEFGMLITKEDDYENYFSVFTECLQTQNNESILTKIVKITDLAEELNITDVRMVIHNATGSNYVHLLRTDRQYLSIKVGDKVDSADKGDMEKLINNYVIYTGVNVNGRWFTFNPPPEK